MSECVFQDPVCIRWAQAGAGREPRQDRVCFDQRWYRQDQVRFRQGLLERKEGSPVLLVPGQQSSDDDARVYGDSRPAHVSPVRTEAGPWWRSPLRR